MHTVNVPMDFLEANQLIAACEQRLRTLRGHEEHGVVDVALVSAIAQTERAERAIRAAFRLPSEAELDAMHEALRADMADLVAIEDIPLAFLMYQGEGR